MNPLLLNKRMLKLYIADLACWFFLGTMVGKFVL